MNSFVINLKRRTDKRKWTEAHFDDYGIPFTRFEAIENTVGWKGCRDSHLQVLEDNKHKWIFDVFEDDVLFLKINPRKDILIAMMQLPDDWDIIFWGISPQEPLTRHSKNLFRVDKRAFCLHAYTINNNNGVIDFILGRRERIEKIDLFMSEEVYPRFNCFVVSPMVATQLQFDSDTCKKSDVSTIFTNFNKFCK